MSNYIPKHNKHTNGIPMYSESGKPAGYVIGNEWRKNIINDWMLRTPPALAVDVVTLQAAINAGAEWLIIHNTESRMFYRASMETFLAKGFEFNRGYGLQRGMVLSAWQQWREGDTPPLLAGVTELKYTSRATKGAIFNGRQLSLFGGK